MWLAFPTLFDFGTPPQVPEAFRPTCHIFYEMRVMDVDDGGNVVALPMVGGLHHRYTRREKMKWRAPSSARSPILVPQS